MNKLLYIVLVIVLFSCKSNSVAQEKEPFTQQKETVKPQKPKIEKPKFIDVQKTLSPGTVHFDGTIMNLSKNSSICDKVYNAVVTVKVDRIHGSGSSIVNIISAGQVINLPILGPQAKDFEGLEQKFTKDQKASFLVTESMCMDMNQTVYEIISSEIIN